MELIADVQFFKDKNKKLVPKEIALLSLKNEFVAHWIVSAVHRVDSLPCEVRKENNWLTRNQHGIDYLEGSVTLKTLNRTLSDIFKSVDKTYVRGKEKWLMFHKMTTREVINLEYDTNCPSFNNLPWSDKYCINHAVKNNYLKFACALNNVYRIKAYLLSKSQSLNNDFPLSSPVIFYNEQPADSKQVVADALTYYRCVPCGSDSMGVDETDGLCI